MRTVNSDAAIPPAVATEYIVGAYMGLLTWWLDSGAQLPPERIDDLFRRLTTRDIIRADVTE